MSVMELFLNRVESHGLIPPNVVRLNSIVEIILNRKMHRFINMMIHLKNNYRKSADGAS